MNGIEQVVGAPGRLTLAGAPEGVDAQFLAGLARRLDGGLLHVARDEGRMMALAEALAFFDPGLEVWCFPAWDCLPYDRASPNAEVAARRADMLSRLAEPGAGAGRPHILVTTVSAALQRVPMRASFAGTVFEGRIAGAVSLDALGAFLARNGYSRSGTVMEPGEFAQRGGLLDIFPPGGEAPMRLDFFGDELESIRLFDPLTQRTTGKAVEFRLGPVSEVSLDQASIDRFRAGYRRAFGAVTGEDLLYHGVSAGRRHIGMEHWLPLFHEGLESLFDFLPEARIALDPLVEEAVVARLSQIEEHFEARKDHVAQRGDEAPPYNPLPSERLYLRQGEWDEVLAARAALALTPFRAPPSESVIDLGGRRGRDFAAERQHDGLDVFGALRDHLRAHVSAGRRVAIAAYSPGSADRLATLLGDYEIDDASVVADGPALAGLARGRLALIVLALEHGFETDDLVVVGEQDILGDRMRRAGRRSRRAEEFLTSATELGVGDLVVHAEHGIARYEGLLTIDVGGAPHDCLHLRYDGGDKLYLPVVNIEMLSRYGSEQAGVALDRLGGAGWQARKARLKSRLEDMAEALIKVASARALKSAPKIDADDPLYATFCARFPFEETEDQSRAIEDVMADLAAGRPMDRLICGDVGFGKTEVALRSAFATVMAGGQVAVVTPTTLLARQHFETFAERFRDSAVEIRQLSRLVATKDAAATRADMESGRVDIVIGTHALLAKRIRFKALELLIVDEEQHFGVKHKERLKQLREDVHVLTLTATPIPRTLQLAMSGVKELSLIATPPVDRLAVRTFVLPFDPVIVREAILREHYRGGQSFYVCPRIQDLPDAATFLRDNIPEVKFVTAHGRLSGGELEEVMSAFYDGAFDVLVTTTIIESGLDIPNANTLVVHRADMFGLAQLYQLRGRIGRAKKRAYSYFTLPPRRAPSANAMKRLKVLQALDTLGAGFSLASHDLDIRGAGNLLGEEQSGHIKEVGLELYQQLLEEAVARARDGEGMDEVERGDWSPQIALGMAVLIPGDYVADLDLRLGLYRRLGRLREAAEIDAFAAELVDRFGPLPREVSHLIEVVEMKRLCREANIEKLEAGPGGATVAFRDNDYANLAGLVAFINSQAGTAKLRPDHRLVFRRQWETPELRLRGARDLLVRLAGIAQASAAPPSAA